MSSTDSDTLNEVVFVLYALDMKPLGDFGRGAFIAAVHRATSLQQIV